MYVCKNVTKKNVSNPITFYNALPTKKRTLLPERQVKCVEDIIVKRYTENLGIPKKEVIQVIS